MDQVTVTYLIENTTHRDTFTADHVAVQMDIGCTLVRLISSGQGQKIHMFRNADYVVIERGSE